ncbi:MAG: DUF418 domain-containing protein [Vicinamibacteria bacterium]
MALLPVQPGERIRALDALRGFALFGILVANWRGFGWPAEYYPTPSAVLHSAADLRVQFLVDLLFGNKFISLLSLLFGIGFAIQLDRAAARGASFLAFHGRRLAGLAVIGCAHAFLLWWGDILLTYVVAGALLWLFRGCGRRALLAWAGALLLLPFWLTLWRIATFSASAGSGSSPRPLVDDVVARAAHAYLHGSWRERLGQNFHDWTVNNADGYFTVLVVLAWFLAGVWLWRSGFVSRLRERASLLKRVAGWCLTLGVAALLLVFHVRQSLHPRPDHLPELLIVAALVRVAATAAVSVGYAAGIAHLAASGRLPRLERGLEAVGRTALSNYLLQSLVGTFVHYGHGLGLYSKVGAAAGMALSLAVFSLQVPLSLWYLSRRRTGPVEWLWRLMSYGRPAEVAATAPTGETA